MDGQGSISPLDLDAMRSLSKQRLPIQSKHVEALLEYLEQIQREARDKALDEAADLAGSRFLDWKPDGDVSCDATACFDIARAIRALKDKGE